MGARDWRAKASVAASLGAATLLIRTLGLRRSARIVWWISDRVPARPLATPPEQLAERQAQVIAAVAERLPFKPRCLPRALVLAGLLRRRGLAGDLCLGTRIAGAFDAHAWIEMGGRPVHEAADLNAVFRCLWRLPTVSR
ncbi:MAG: lasso peptide biosynthesis B2 protein [Brevundimonas sp.]